MRVVLGVDRCERRIRYGLVESSMRKPASLNVRKFPR
jgi:hypothetical protein